MLLFATKSVTTGVKPSKKLKEQFALFLEQHPARPLSTVLGQVLLDYMAHQMKIGFP